jgi:Domain of Unknown Function (DUF1080)/Fibronectin type III domain
MSSTKKLRSWFFLFLFAGIFDRNCFAQETTALPPKNSTYAPAVFVSLFDGKTLNGWTGVPETAWTVKDSAIAMTGDNRGVIYTNRTYSSYRIIFSVRQIKGIDHWPCVLIFGPDPKLDALGAVQFQLPKGYSWDYRPGKNNDGRVYFSHIGKIQDVNKTDWARCEILVDAATGSSRSAAAQPIGSPAVEILDFKDASIDDIPTPFALQSHNKGQFDEYKEISIEVDPQINELLTVLAAPTDLTAKAMSGKEIDLTWTDNSAVEDGFKIERSMDNLNWKTLAIVPVNTTSYSDTRLALKSPYYYRISAFNTVVTSAYAFANGANRR